MNPFPLKQSANIIRRIIELLSCERFSEIEHMDKGKRVTADQLRTAIEEYDAAFVPIPLDQELDLNIIEVPAAELPTWSVIVPLYSREEGKSDLSLSLVVIQKDDSTIEIEIEDLHVL